MRRRTTSILLCAALAAAAACHGTSGPERLTNRVLSGSRDGLAGAVDSPINLEFPDQPGLLDVKIKNASGDVLVLGRAEEATGDTKVRIEPRIEVRAAGDSKMQLEKIKWVARVDPNDHGGHTLFIEVGSTDIDAWFVGSDIEVEVPRLGAVTVDTKRGKIMVDDNRGPVDLSTVRGEIRMRTPWPITQPCAMVTKDADIVWISRGQSSGEFDCETIGGNIVAYCRMGRWNIADHRNDKNSLHAILNSGSNPVVMRNVDGDIRITIVEDPHDTGSFHWP
ncbi:MAG: hypothetical protein K8R92_06290 [Planctomycetes bacterium]|nr:hypothetical protein [Planctomycetota bacterium]